MCMHAPYGYSFIHSLVPFARVRPAGHLLGSEPLAVALAAIARATGSDDVVSITSAAPGERYHMVTGGCRIGTHTGYSEPARVPITRQHYLCH